MSRSVFCKKYQQEMEGLDQPPYPGPKGEEIFETISKQAWADWQAHQTMLINEYRLNPMDPKAKELITGEMEKFLFGAGSEKPADYVPPQNPNDPITEEF